LSNSDAARLAAALGIAVDTTKAAPVIIAFSPDGTPLSGVKFALDPPGGGVRWYRDSAAGVGSATLTETGSSGLGGWMNLPPGTYTVRATIAGKTCTTGDAVPGASPGTGIMEAFADSVGETFFFCE
jgi:hypothetical protein